MLRNGDTDQHNGIVLPDLVWQYNGAREASTVELKTILSITYVNCRMDG
jgi:hypothetical protein